MEKFILIVLFCVFSFCPIEIYSQSYFSLYDLMEFSNCESLSQFDEKIRSNGYLFEQTSEDKKANCTDYEYSKRYLTSDVFYDNFIIYSDFKDKRPVIYFMSSIKGFYDDIQEQIKANKFKEKGVEGKGKAINFMYENNDYKLHFTTFSKERDYSKVKYNAYKVAIWKKYK